jgi:hypothetical protein
VPNILVLANETIGGGALLDRIRERAGAGGSVHFHVVVPQTRPRHGNVIYDEVVRDSAQVRVDLALEFMRDEGIAGTGEVGDGDPFTAAMDAIRERPIDEIIVSTLPATLRLAAARLIERPAEGDRAAGRARGRGPAAEACVRCDAGGRESDGRAPSWSSG